MKVELPQRDPFPQFVKMFSDQLTAVETHAVLSVPEDEGLRRFFWIWTMKEAYTKALGLGMGFDFKRIEYDVAKNILTVDGSIPKGWQLVKFEIDHGMDVYQGVTANFIGGNETIVLSRFSESTNLVRYDATTFVLRALDELK
jgi:4'-phosphopantetheinyl transferase